MMRFCQKNKGTISVFLILILLPTIIFGGLVIDSTRIYSSNTIISGAGDLAMNAGLSHYSSELKDMYGLFAMAKTPEDIQDSLQEYFEQSINDMNLDRDTVYSTIVQLQNMDGEFAATGVNNTQISNPDIMEQQIVEYMKFRGPIVLADDLLTKFKAISKVDEEAKIVEAEADYSEKVGDFADAMKPILEDLDEHIKAIEEAGNISDKISEVHAGLGIVAELKVAKECLDQVENGPGTASVPEELNNEPTPEEIIGMLNAKVPEDGNLVELVNDFPNVYKIVNIKKWITVYTDAGYDTTGEVKKTWEERKTSIESALAYYASGWKEQLAEVNKKIDEIKALGEKGSTSAKNASEKLVKLDEKYQLLRDQKAAVNVAKNTVNDDPDDPVTGAVAASGSDPNALANQKLPPEDEYKTEENTALQEKLQKNKELFDQISNCKNVEESEIPQVDSYTLRQAEELSLDTASNYYYEDQVLPLWAVTFSYDFEDIANDPMYLFLKKQCTENKTPDDEKEKRKKEEAENKEKAKNSQNWDENIAVLEETAVVEEDFPSKQTTTNSNSNTGKNVDLSGNTNKLSSNAKSFLGGNSLLSSLDGAAGYVAANAYIMEYMSQLFSCYTTGVGSKGSNTVSPFFSRGDFSEDEPLYRAELEYILYGNLENDQRIDSSKNITIALSTIFAIRFVFNCIYCFTDSTEIAQATTTATAIAAFTGGWGYIPIKYGLLVLKAVIYSGEDIGNLMAGKDVAIYRTNKTDSVTMNYREYLQAIMLFALTNAEWKKAMLVRTGDNIQLMMDHKGAEIRLTKGYTMLTVKAKVTTETSFIPMIPKYTKSGNVDDYKKRYTLPYTGILGY